MISWCILLFRNNIEYKNADREEKQWVKEIEVKKETVNESVFINLIT